MRISDWSSDVCSSDLRFRPADRHGRAGADLYRPLPAVAAVHRRRLCRRHGRGAVDAVGLPRRLRRQPARLRPAVGPLRPPAGDPGRCGALPAGQPRLHGCALHRGADPGPLRPAVGACVGPAIGRAAVRDIYGRERSGRMLAYMGMVMALAPAFGPILGGFLEVWFGWRANFAVLALFSVIILAASFVALPETNRWKSRDATRLGHLVGNYRALLRHRSYVGYLLVVACTYSGIFAFISGSSFVLIGLSSEEHTSELQSLMRLSYACFCLKKTQQITA